MLLRQPVSSDDSCLPSPNQLKGKIIIKVRDLGGKAFLI